MSTTPNQAGAGTLPGIHPRRLFVASCISLISTAVVFIVVGAIMGDLKKYFVLDNTDVGWIAGAATWGFTVSIFVLGPLCDAIGMRFLLRFAFLCHLVGVLVMIFATGFWMLFWGALIIALGNGTVEAVCNPLIATIFPDKKTAKLNQFHMWFPGGIVIGGLIAYVLTWVGLAGSPHLWQVRLAVVLVPTLIYGVLFTGQKFPATERVASGVSFGGMFKETLLRPLFLILFLCMMITASLELGPQRWIPSVLEAGGIPGILVLCWITGLMAVLRGFAGPVVHKLSNVGVLLLSSVLAGIGLVLLSYMGSISTALGVPTVVIAFVAATVFALGVCYFWPTMLGTAAERVPKGGALALALLGGMGMLIVGVVTTPEMGAVADVYLHQKLAGTDTEAQQTAAVLEKVAATYVPLAADQPDTEAGKIRRAELHSAVAEADKVLKTWAADHKLPEVDTANALRSALKNGPAAAETAAEKAALAAKDKAADILNPADNYGGLMSFRYVAPFAALLVIIFGVMYLVDKKRGSLPAEKVVR